MVGKGFKFIRIHVYGGKAPLRAKFVIVAFLLLIMTYLPAFALISILILVNSSFALAVKSSAWVPIPVIIIVTLCMAMLLIAIVGRRQFAEYGFKLSRGFEVWKALFTGFLVGTILYVSAELSGFKLTWMGQPPFAYVILLFWIGAPIQEEIIFRGLFQGYLATHIKSSIIIWKLELATPAFIGAIAFSLVHLALLSVEATLGGVLITVIGAFILGIISGHFLSKTDSLIGPIIVHALFNLTPMVFGLLC